MIPPEADAILTGDDQPRVAVRKATFVGVVNKAAQVDMGDSRFLCDFGGGYIPVVGEAVRIWSIGDQHFLFPAGPRPAVGTVLTVAGLTVSVSTSVGTVTAAYAGTAPTSGDRVGIVWSEDGAWCSQKLSSTPPPPEPVPDPGGGPKVRSATFKAIDTGSHNLGSSNYWQAQPWAGNTVLGGWFYGTQIRDTIPAGAVFQSLEFYVDRPQDQGGAPNFGLHGYAGKTGQLSFQNVTAWDPGSGWQTPPNASTWFNALKAGGGRLGVGLQHGGFNKFSSRAQNSMTGALRISWKA